ncbi:FliG C-terminal domain-containing protein [Halobacteriovorax sp. GB3]|uniref:FliG C-terminal domain-containing protein n=1 Tax=Halobacteriovorax sp. GB3 TaxID=2719615 RepID=UPI00235F4AB9|nr:FliG C-terminal domain-containing protein [Halobacteriovorax sp. GB3]MDD0853504.1 FliG C-terminal domain-containing protein [Halobacteriovorax sp. GB3]
MFRINGLQEAILLLKGLNSSERKRILEQMAKRDPELVAKIEKSLISVSDLAGLTIKMKVDLLKNISLEKIAICLKLQSIETREAVLEGLPTGLRAEAMDILDHRKMPLNEVYQVEQEVLELLVALQEKGLINFGSDEFV